MSRFSLSSTVIHADNSMQHNPYRFALLYTEKKNSGSLRRMCKALRGSILHVGANGSITLNQK